MSQCQTPRSHNFAFYFLTVGVEYCGGNKNYKIHGLSMFELLLSKIAPELSCSTFFYHTLSLSLSHCHHFFPLCDERSTPPLVSEPLRGFSYFPNTTTGVVRHVRRESFVEVFDGGHSLSLGCLASTLQL